MVSLALPQNVLNQWLTPQRIRQLIALVNTLLVIWLAWQLAALTWMLLPQQEAPPPAPVVVAKSPVVQSSQQIDEQRLARLHLFGVADKVPLVKKQVKAPVDAPETRLKLTLRGLFASSDKQSARAIVADPRGKEEIYSVGDPLPGSAKLSEVFPDRIILERGGNFETLRLPRESIDVSSSNSLKPASVTRSSSQDSAAAFQKYRSEIKRNPATFLNYVRATPARENGKFIGFRLQAGRQPNALKELGLQPGDIVTAINGVDIDSPAKGMKAMQALGEGSSVNVTLLRKNEEVSMNLSLPTTR